MPRAKPAPSPKRSDKPAPPRLPDHLPQVDLATIGTGEWNDVELTGTLPDDFDEPLLLTSVKLHRASLVGARLEGSRFVDVAVVASELSGVDLLESSFTKVVVTDSRLSGAQMAQARLRDVCFVDSRLEDANFAMTTGERVRFQTCRLDRADFRSARFEGVAWWDCDLTDAEVSQIRLVRAQLQGSNLDGLRGAKDLKPVAVDAGQFPVIAEYILASMGVTVSERTD